MVITTGQVLDTAAQHIRQFNWVTETFGNHSLGLCLHGAVYSALIELYGYEYDEYDENDFKILNVPMSEKRHKEITLQSYEVVRTLTEVLPDTCSCNYSALSKNSFVYHYNDFHCTGKEDAVLLLEQAKEKWLANHA